MSDNRTMIGLPYPGVIGADVHEIVTGKKRGEVVEVNGEQYARLPEGWPAAEDKDLEEAHAEAVANEGITEEEILSIYSTFSPEEVRELVEDWSRLVQENFALRKGMKTMQRKQRKQNQVQRRLERRLAQARNRRDQLMRDEETGRTISSYLKSIAEMRNGEGVTVRGGE